MIGLITLKYEKNLFKNDKITTLVILGYYTF